MNLHNRDRVRQSCVPWILLVVLFVGVALNARAQIIPDQQAQTPQSPPPHGRQTPRQEENKTPEAQVPRDRWNLFWQATSIGQYHGTFPSPYEDQFSLQNYPERDVSLTTTLFFGLRLDQNTQLYFDPEIAGGRGFSGVNGLDSVSMPSKRSLKTLLETVAERVGFELWRIQ